MNKKIKIFSISDMPLSTSGVAIQTRNFIEGLLKTGRFTIDSFGGAMKHQDNNPIKTKEWGDDWTIYPVEGFGTQEQVRSFVMSKKPDILWFITDPRYYKWLWEISCEIREKVPFVYYNVWDNFPIPHFNKPWWGSNDLLVSMSQVTYDLNKAVVPEVERIYLPLAIDADIFQKKDMAEVTKVRHQMIRGENKNKFVFFWVNRNAKRKQAGTLIWWFKDFLHEIGKDNACLIMHTDAKDQFGQDLEAVINAAGLNNGEVLISPQKLPPQDLSFMYSAADCVFNIADAEGVGCGTLESLSCETPIIATKTGGLQEQFDGVNGKTGFWLEPKAKSVVGSQEVPFIYEDRVTKKDFLKACHKMYNLSPEEREKMGKTGRELILRKYNLKKYQEKWVEIIDNVYKKHGSWDTRKNYKPWSLDVF